MEVTSGIPRFAARASSSMWMGSRVRWFKRVSSSGESGTIFWFSIKSVAWVRSRVSKMSRAEVTALAPILMRLFGPAAVFELMLPGTAKTSRFWSREWRAVIKAPEASGASMTNVPRERPETMRFRAGKFCLSGKVLMGYSDTTRPPESIIFWAK